MNTSKILPLAVCLVSLTVILLGWLGNTPWILSIIPGAVTMKFATALTLFLQSVGALAISEENPKLEFVSATCHVAAIIILMFVIWSPVITTDPGDAFTVRVGMPSFGTLFAALGITAAHFMVTVFPSGRVLHQWKMHQVTAVGVSLLTVVAFIGYLTNSPILFYYFPELSTGMAIHTAACYLALALANFNLKGSPSHDV